MFKLIETLLGFLKEFSFSNKEEADPSSPKFNKNRWRFYIILAFSVSLNILIVPRLMSLSIANVKLSEEKEKLNTRVQELNETYFKLQKAFAVSVESESNVEDSPRKSKKRHKQPQG